MFLDTSESWPPPPPNEPPAPPTRLTRREEHVIVWIVVFNLVFLVIGPLAGASLVEGLIRLFLR